MSFCVAPARCSRKIVSPSCAVMFLCLMGVALTIGSRIAWATSEYGLFALNGIASP